MASQWFYKVMGDEIGPVSSAELRNLAQRGVISSDTLLKNGPDAAWVPAERVQGLFCASDAMPWLRPRTPTADNAKSGTEAPNELGTLVESTTSSRNRQFLPIAVFVMVVFLAIAVLAAGVFVLSRDRSYAMRTSPRADVTAELDDSLVGASSPARTVDKNTGGKQIEAEIEFSHGRVSQDLVDEADARTRRFLEFIPQEGRKDAERKLQAMPVAERLKSIEMFEEMYSTEIAQLAELKKKRKELQDRIAKEEEMARRQAFLLLTDQEKEMVGEILRKLKTEGFKAIGEQEMKFAFLGRGRPFLLDALRHAAKESVGTYWDSTSRMLDLDVDQKIALATLSHEELAQIRHIGEILVNRSDTLTTDQFEFARNNPFLKEKLLEYRERGLDVKKTAANTQKRIRGWENEIERCREEILSVEKRIARLWYDTPILQKSIATNTTTLEIIEQKLAKIDRSKSNQAARIKKDLDAQRSVFREKIEQDNKKVRNNCRALDDADTSVKSLRQRIAYCEEQIGRLRSGE